MGTPRLLGIIGAVLYGVGFLLVSSVPGGGEPTAEEFQDFYVTDQDTLIPLVGGFILTLGALAILWFLHDLRRGLVDHGLSGLGLGLATAGLGIVLVGGAILTGPSGVQEFGDGGFVGQEIAHTVAQSGFATMLVPGALFLGAGVIVLAHLGRRAGAFPDWVGIAGYVAGALQLVAFIWIPAFLIPLWVLLASALRRPSAGDAGSVVTGSDMAAGRP